MQIGNHVTIQQVQTKCSIFFIKKTIYCIRIVAQKSPVEEFKYSTEVKSSWKWSSQMKTSQMISDFDFCTAESNESGCKCARIILLRLVSFCNNTTGDMWCTSKEGWVWTAGVDSHWLSQHISRLWKRLRHDPLVLPLCSLVALKNTIIRPQSLPPIERWRLWKVSETSLPHCFLATSTSPRLHKTLP